MIKVHILCTTDYKLFHRIKSNREINKNHLKRLKASILAKNLLHLFPIIVNKQWEIIDGQHRLVAAEELKLPIYYIIEENITKADIALVNNNRRGWTSRDYVSFYAKDGSSPYVRLEEILNDYPITVMCGVRLLDEKSKSYFEGGGNQTLKMRTGAIGAEGYPLAKKILKMADTLSTEYEHSFRAPFLLNMKSFLMDKSNPDKWINKIYNSKALLPKDIDYFRMPIFKRMFEHEDVSDEA